MIHNNENRIKGTSDPTAANRRQNINKKSLMSNIQMGKGEETYDFYKSLPQPFINKKQLSSF